MENAVARIDDLRTIARNYGQGSIELDRLAKALAPQIVATYNEYLEPGGAHAGLTTLADEWDPGKDYRDACFSSYHVGLLRLDGVQFGIYTTIIPDVLSLRSIVTIQREGDQLVVSVGDVNCRSSLQPNVLDLESIAGAIYRDVEREYGEDVNTYFHGDAKALLIGFRS